MIKPQIDCPYTAKATSLDDGWGYQLIEIFLNNKKIGEFKRNYHSYGEKSFAPFFQNNRWYALCSPNYVGLDIMSLPDCKIIKGETKHSGGFCPVETFIPMYQWCYTLGVPKDKLDEYPKQNHHWIVKDSKCKEYGPNGIDQEWGVIDENGEFTINAPLHYENFAFVSGCIWGDDSSWKIELRDITEAYKGIIKKIDWGYHQLPRNVSLQQAIEIYNQNSYLDDWKERTFINFASVQQFNYHDRKLL